MRPPRRTLRIWLPTSFVATVVIGVFVILVTGAPDWLSDADQAASVSSLAVGLSALVVAVITLALTAKPPPVDPETARGRARAHLARLVEQELDEESAVRGLAQPEPIRLKWTRAAGGPVPGAGAGRIVRTKDDGDITTALADWRRLPTRQLVVLGEPGAGKTSLATILARGIVKDLQPDEPVPVLFSMAEWNPRDEPFDTWVRRRLEEQYPALTDARTYGPDIARALVEHRLLLLVLDGLDEIPETLRAMAATTVARSLADRPFVLTCRTRDFDRLVATRGLPFVRASAVRICDVSPELAARFLSQGQISGPERWAAVARTMTDEPKSPLAQVLTTPLMVYLARVAYGPPTRDPSGLLTFRKAKALREHLLDAYLPALYPDPAEAERVRCWLRSIAGQARDSGTKSWAWWNLVQSIPGPAFFLPIALASALMGGVAIGIAIAPPFGALMGLTMFVVARSTGRNVEGVRPRHIHFSWPNVLYGIARQNTVGLLVAVPATFLAPGVLVLAGTLGYGLFSGLALGLAKFADPDRPANFERSLRNDRRAFILVFLAYGLPVGLVCQWMAAMVAAPAPSVLAGVACGLAGGVSLGIAICWPRYAYTRWVLAAKGVLPWRLAPFLVDAYSRGILRRSGAAYEFRHDQLFKFFADPPRKSDQTGRRPAE